MPHRVGLSCVCASSEEARAIAAAIAPEVGAVDNARSETRLDRTGARLVLQIDAEDLTALRAAMNSWCRLLATATAVQG
jgi:KEOPS complex subunit Pcc1